MNLEIFASVLAALIVYRLLSPVIDRFTGASAAKKLYSSSSGSGSANGSVSKYESDS
ncbi:MULTISPECIES: hypothetical protein [Halomonas]|uniref:hypothetical protein n=1 Tax=Halomonas TaxID=2745 RepID=UPI003CEFC41A